MSKENGNRSDGGSGFSRRDFLRVSSAGMAGALVGGWGVGRSMQALANEPRPIPPSSVQVNFDSWINPPPGNLLRNPAPIEATRSGNIVTTALHVGPSVVQIDNGPGAELWTYNGEFPGPTLRVRSGDIVRLGLTNNLPAAGTNALGHHRTGCTNLHTHGWHVSPCGNSDNVFLHIDTGTTFNFEFNLAKQRPSSTNFYHPHVHGLVAEQMWAGLAGALIVEDGDVAPSIARYSVPGKEYVMVLKDLSLDAQGRPAPYTHHDFQMGKEGDLVMVNGQVHPVLRMRPGEVKRLRFINASTSRYYTLSVEGHGAPDMPDGFHVIGTDGGLLANSVRVNTPNPELMDADGNPVTNLGLSPFMTIAVAERVDMLFKATMMPGTYRVFSLPYDRGHDKRQLVTLMTVVVEGAPLDEPIPAVVNTRPEIIPQAVFDNIDSFPRRTIELTMEMDDVDHDSMRNFINGIEFKGTYPNETSFKVTSRVGADSYEVWDVIDNSTMDHPFHIHTNDFRILKITCGNGEIDYAAFYDENPQMRSAWKDTLNVGKGGMSFSVLVPVTNFTGDAVFHCHILEHEDTGMMGRWIRGNSCA